MISFSLSASPLVAASLFLIGSLNLLLGLFVFIKSGKSATSLIFFLLCAALTLWSFSHAVIALGASPASMGLGAKGTVLAGLFIPFLLLLFSKSFPRHKLDFSALIIGLSSLPVVILFILVAIGNIITTQALSARSIQVNLSGSTYAYSLYFLLYFFMAAANIVTQYRSANSLERTRFKYFFSGIILSSFTGAILSLFLLPFGFHQLVSFGPLSTVFLVGATAYAILRYRLMDINLAIKKTTAYSLVTTAITFTYVLVVVAFELLFRVVYGHYSFWASLPAALVIAVTFVPLRERVQGVTDRLFFRRMIEYQKVLKEITNMIASVTDLHTLFRLIDRTVVRVMCLKNASVLLLEEKENQYIVEKTNGVPGIVGLRLPLDDALVQYLIEKKDAVVLEEVRSLLKTAPADSPEYAKLALVAEEMERFSAAIAIPSFLKEKLVGILNLGEKLSGEMYGPDDIELLLTLASEAAIAIENAKLYRDITETRDYLNSLVESSDDAILTLDLEGKVLSWNQGAAKIFGSKSQETIGRIPPFISQVELNTLIGKVAAGQEVRSLALTQRTREGRDLPLLLTLSPIKDHNGKLVGISAILTDISELKKVDRLKHEFLSVISHELRTPLTPIKGYLTLLLEGKMGELPSKQRQALEIVLKQSDHLHDLIDSVIDISRIEAGRKIELDKEPLFLGEVIEGCLAANEANFGMKQLDLLKELPAERAALLGDRKKLLRLMDNLLSNAIKFTPLKGELGVKLEKRGRYFQVTLSDSGIGLAAEELTKIFEPFYQVDTSYTRSSGGMGMGLTIAKEIVEAHGGRIWAESDGPGKGSRFIFTV